MTTAATARRSKDPTELAMAGSCPDVDYRQTQQGAAGLPDTLRTYDLRHSHASLLIDQGANLLAIAQRMVHSDPAFTLRVYGHLFAGVQEDLTARLDTHRKSMRAVRVEEFGVDTLKVRDLPDPIPGASEVLIATEAATINPADSAVVTGAAAPRLPRGAVGPYTPGWDLVGRITACGDGIDDLLIGSRVLGFSLWFESIRGTQASAVALPIGNVVPVPDDLPPAQLTTVGLNGLNAWRGLADLRLNGGETVVVTGAAGGVGGLAVELASSRGFSVTGVVHEEGDMDEALALGATAVVIADSEALGGRVREVAPGGADALLDTASIGAPALAALRDNGKYVTVTNLPAPERGIDVFRSGGRMDAEALTTLVEMASSGRLHTPVNQVFDLADARNAYEAFTHRRGRGRIVLSFPSA
jgi:NADPH:quinone reductase